MRLCSRDNGGNIDTDGVECSQYILQDRGVFVVHIHIKKRLAMSTRHGQSDTLRARSARSWETSSISAFAFSDMTNTR